VDVVITWATTHHQHGSTGMAVVFLQTNGCDLDRVSRYDALAPVLVGRCHVNRVCANLRVDVIDFQIVRPSNRLIHESISFPINLKGETCGLIERRRINRTEREFPILSPDADSRSNDARHRSHIHDDDIVHRDVTHRAVFAGGGQRDVV
jgi:hypothetical protein